MSEDDFKFLSEDNDTEADNAEVKTLDEEAAEREDAAAEESKDLGIQAVPGEEFDKSGQEFIPLSEGGDISDDSNKDGAPATTLEVGTVSKDFEEAIKNKVEQFDQEEVRANSGPVPVGLSEANDVVVVEPQAEESGYVLERLVHNTQPYLVQADSVLAGHPWYIQPGTVQGRTMNPPLSDDLARELGLDKLV